LQSKKKGSTKPEEPTARLVRAVGHPLRLRILEALAKEVGSATTLSELLDVPLSNVSYHLNHVLDEECGGVELVKTQQARGSIEKFYVPKGAVYLDAIAWPAIPRSIRDGLWGASLKTFVSIAVSALKGGALNGSDSPWTLAWRPVLVDDRGQVEINNAMGEVEQRIEEAKRKSADRLKKAKVKRLHQMIVGLAAFKSAGPLRESTTEDAGD
jgi:DNA-binding transcriptional ArsR family regulator